MALPKRNRCTAVMLCLLAVIAYVAVEAAPASPSIAAYLKSQPKFSVLYSYLNKAGLLKTLANRNLQVTFFAPVNSAFTPAVKSVLDNWLDGVYGQVAASMLQSHIALGVWKSDCIRTGVTLETFYQAWSESPRVLIPDTLAVPGKVLVRAKASAATVLKGDVRAGKSLIHEVDTFLLFSPAQRANYSSISDAILGLKLTKFQALVNSYVRTPSRLDVGDIIDREDVPGTVFAFTDATWQQTVAECGQEPPAKSNIVAYSVTFDYLPAPGMPSNYQFKTMYLVEEERTVAPPAEARITWLKGKKLPSIIIERGRRILNITQSVYTRNAVLHILDGIPYPAERDNLCGY